MSHPKRYFYEEAARILARAAELQQRENDCIRLAELEASAHEVGIDASVIREAARELEIGKLARRPEQAIARAKEPGTATSGFAGAPMQLQINQRIHGSMHVSYRERISQELHAHFGDLQAHHSDQVWRWKTRGPASRDVNISVRPRGNGLDLWIEERSHRLAGSMYGGILGGVGDGGGMRLVLPLTLVFAPWIAALTWIATVFFIVRHSFSLSVRRRHEQLKSSASEVARTPTCLRSKQAQSKVSKSCLCSS